MSLWSLDTYGLLSVTLFTSSIQKEAVSATGIGPCQTDKATPPVEGDRWCMSLPARRLKVHLVLADQEIKDVCDSG